MTISASESSADPMPNDGRDTQHTDDSGGGGPRFERPLNESSFDRFPDSLGTLLSFELADCVHNE